MGESNYVDVIAEPQRIPEALKQRKDAAAHRNAEARTYAQMLANIPLVTELDGAPVLDSRGLMAIGPSLLHDLARAAMSQIVKPLAARAVPVGGTYDTLLACEGVAQFVDGVNEYTQFNALTEQVVQHAMVCPGGGHVLCDTDAGQNLVPLVLHPLYVFPNHDRSDVLFQRFVGKRQAKARVKTAALKAVIQGMPCKKPEPIAGVDSPSQWDAEDLVCITEYYAIPVGDEKGVHITFYDDRNYVVEEFKDAQIPIATMTWASGFHGRGFGEPMARSVAGTHTWLKEIWLRINDSSIACVPWLKNAPAGWRPNDVPHQKVPVGENGKDIEIEFPPAMSKDLLELSMKLEEQAGKATGMDKDATASTPPSEVTSGVAIASWTAVRNESLGPQHRQYDNLYKQWGTVLCARAAAVYASKAAMVQARGTDVIRQVSWGELNVGEKQGFQVSFDVVSGLSTSLPQRIQLLDVLLEKTAIDLSEYLASINLPDYRARAQRLGGPRAYVERQIVECLKGGDWLPPCEMQGTEELTMLEKSARQAWFAAASMEIPPPKDRLNQLRILWKLAKERLEGGATTPTPVAEPVVEEGASLSNASGSLADTAANMGVTAEPLPINGEGLPANPMTGAPAPIEAPPPIGA